MSSTPIIRFTPCCAPGDYYVIFGGSNILGIPNNSYWVYTGGTTIFGEGTAPWDSLIPGQCYNITYQTLPFIFPGPPLFLLDINSFSNSTFFFPYDKTCTAPYCINACSSITPEPTNNRYLQYVPCCPNTGGPTLYFRVPGINVPMDGVASYIGTISPAPYPTTDVNGNITNPLVQNKCYSITLHSVGVGEPVSNNTQYYNLVLAPQDLLGNYIYHSPVFPAEPDISCENYIRDCPECNPLCFTLWSCDGSQPLFTTSTDLTAFVGFHITVSSVDVNYNIVNLCVFVQNTTQFNCTNAIEVTFDSEDPYCECPCTCYTITGNIKSIEYINCDGVADQLGPFLGISTTNICSLSYPIVYDAEGIPVIINNGDCIEDTFFNNETCEEETILICEPACYLLEDCLDNTNVIYSTSPSLGLPANLGQVVTIAGHTECWKILIPEECICPINVTVLTVSECCEQCLPNINYKLTLCEDSSTFIYTSTDLSLYVDKVIRREDCTGCWIVSQIDGNIPTDTPIIVIEDYLDCEKCYRKYYLLEDCLGLELDIITYSDLSDYVNKVITLDWCPETCWTVTETIENDIAGVISDVLNSYAECIDCLTNAPCVCSTIKNYNDISQTYQYLDCEGILQTITLLPGKKSRRLCLIRWYVPEPCDELIVTITSSIGVVSNIILYQNSVNHPGPVIVNNKPTWKDAGNNLYVYYDGTKWILSKNFTPLVLPPVYTTIGFINCNGDCDCPTGTWQQSSSIPNQDVYVTTEFKYTIEYFGNCKNGRCPARKNNQKVIKPGYKTCACETWKYEEITCKSSESLYKQVLQLRYGISNCCPEDDEKYIIQKELIDLQCIIPPDETPNCFFGLVLETIYLGEYSDISLLPLEWQNIGLGNPTSTCGLGVGCHGCSNALFELEADSVSLGESKMNNAGGNITTGSTTSYGTVICGDYINTPAPLTGGSWTGTAYSRYSKIVVDEDIAQALSDATSGGILTISAKCSKQLYNCTAPSCSCESGFGGGCHTNVTFLRVTQGNILLYAGGIGGDIEVTIDPCSPVPIPPLPPLVINTIYTTFTALPPVPVPNVNTIYTTFSALLPNVSYNCFLGVCADPGDGSGVYPTLIACEEECVPTPPIPTCSVFINFGDAVYVYFPSSNTNLFLGNSFVNSSDIAHTTTKLWMYDSSLLLIYEYDITLNPWSATFNRTIAFPSGIFLGNGLGAINNTQLISTNNSVSPEEIIVLDITTNTAVSTVIGTLGAGRIVSGDILLTTTNKILVTNQNVNGNGIFLSQYSYPSGTFEVEVDITSTLISPWGIFIDSGNIYVCNDDGQMYNVDVNFPYTQTLFNNSGLGIGGASQVPSCCNANLIVEPPCAPCTTAGRLPQFGNSVTYNGIVISASGTGSIGVTTFSYPGIVCPLPLPNSLLSTVWLGNNGMPSQPFIYTLTFSVPVNDIVIRLYSYNSITTPQAESFTFTTNTGSGSPVISSCQYCCATINSNTITAANTSPTCSQGSGVGSSHGNGIFKISNSSPFTTVTVAGPGGLNGTVMDICTDSVIPVPPPNISYNCFNGNCTDPGDGSGVYSTLLDCQQVCVPPPCAPCTTAGRLPQVGNSVTHTGIIISASGTGSISMFTGGYLGYICPLPLPGSTLNTTTFALGSMWIDQPFSYTLTFSVPVNNIAVRLYGYNSTNNIIPIPVPQFIYPFAESFTFTTNTGSGLPEISSCQYCCAIINGNTITAGNTSSLCDQWSSGYITNGNGIFTISNSLPFTTVTVAGPGRLDGVTMDICTDSLIPVPPPVFSYNCVNGNCVFVSGPSGTYPTLAACTNACVPPVITTYNCTNGNCVSVSGSGGTYPTLLLCQNNCGSANTIYTTFDIL